MTGAIIFTGAKNGRPTFDFPGQVPPKWLRDLGFARVEFGQDGKPVLNAGRKQYRVGDALNPADHGG